MQDKSNRKVVNGKKRKIKQNLCYTIVFKDKDGNEYETLPTPKVGSQGLHPYGVKVYEGEEGYDTIKDLIIFK